MQQVTNRRMSFGYKFKNHNHNSLILQEKMRESEWRRTRLEIEFNELIQQGRTTQDSDLMGYKRRYRDLLESEKYRVRRNEQLIATLKRLEMRISFLSATTEKYKALRSKYKVFTNKIQRARVVEHPSFPQNIPVDNSYSKSKPNRNQIRSEPQYYLDDESALSSSRRTYQETNIERPVSSLGTHQIQNRPYLIYKDDSRGINDHIASNNHQDPSEHFQYTNPSRGVSYRDSTNETLPKSRSYMIGNEDRSSRDEYSDEIRHQTANNSENLSLGQPKYETVDRSTSDINKYAMNDLIHLKSNTVAAVYPAADKLRLPEEILKKYTSPDFSISVENGLMEKQTMPSQRKVLIENDNLGNKTFSHHGSEKNILSLNVQPGNITEDNENFPPTSKNQCSAEENVTYTIETPKEKNVVKLQNAPEIIEADEVQIIQNVTEPQTAENKPQTSVSEMKNSIQPIEDEKIEPQSSLEEKLPNQSENEEMIIDEQGNNPASINMATEEVIEDLECAGNIVPRKPSTDIISPDAQLETEQNMDNEEHLVQVTPIQSNELFETKSEENQLENENLNEELSKLKLDDEVAEISEEQHDSESNSEQPKDPDVAESCQEETSEKNISNETQNSQQEPTQLNHNTDHENSEDPEMKRFKKRNSNTQPEPYYDQNNQNYPVDGQSGQPYDMSGQPINYDPGQPSGTQDQYGQGYEAVYNEKGELVMPYDQTGQQYDQQYYQNDPNYANYDQYGQQYGEYDQEGYDPAQQGNYDPAQQGYDPNSQYNAYYAEVKYNQDAFYQGDTQESAPNPQNEENEGSDKAGRLMHMLESDTETSSRQEHKVTTESDFDYSNN